jgi:hypothetical protein
MISNLRLDRLPLNLDAMKYGLYFEVNKISSSQFILVKIFTC